VSVFSHSLKYSWLTVHGSNGLSTPGARREVNYSLIGQIE
jgi:hypothetical protein